MVLLLVLLAAVSAGLFASAEHKLVVLHSSDAQSHFTDVLQTTGGYCSQRLAGKGVCMGGLSRTLALVKDFRSQHAAGTAPPVLYFYNGNIFIGSVYFILYKADICVKFMNMLKPDVVSLGTSDFRVKSSLFNDYVTQLTSPVVLSNVDITPPFPKLLQYKIVTVGNINIGVMGYVGGKNTLDAHDISDKGREAISQLATSLHNQGAVFIILLSSDTFKSDMRFARDVPYLDLVIGGDEDAFLWNRDLEPPPETTEVVDTYPKVIESDAGGHRTRLVVRVLQNAMYLGVLNLTLDPTGAIADYAGQPVFLTADMKKDPEAEKLLAQSYTPGVLRYEKEVLTMSWVYLRGGETACHMQECNLGNVIADAYLSRVVYNVDATPLWSYYGMTLIRAANVQRSIDPSADNHNITKLALMEAMTTSDQICLATLTGDTLLMILQTLTSVDSPDRCFPQVAGLRLVLDLGLPSGRQLVSVKGLTTGCRVPKYENLDPAKTYNIVTSRSITRKCPHGKKLFSGAHHQCLKDDVFNIVSDYLKSRKVLLAPEEGRIRVKTTVKSSAGSLRGPLHWALLFIFLLSV